MLHTNVVPRSLVRNPTDYFPEVFGERSSNYLSEVLSDVIAWSKGKWKGNIMSPENDLLHMHVVMMLKIKFSQDALVAVQHWKTIATSLSCKPKQ